jgi:transposase
MAKYTRFIDDEQFKKIEPLLPKLKIGCVGRPCADNREVLERILWILRTGARWKDLLKRYPSASACRRRLSRWEEDGVWLKVWRKFLSDLDEKALLDWEEAFIDGRFAKAKKGALGLEKPKGEKDRSGWWWSTARVFLWKAPLPRHPRTK